MNAAPRSRAQRRRDTEHRLAHDVDLWVASASPDGAPYLVPLSFDWDGAALLLATPAHSPTGRNLAATRTVRLGLGHTRDVTVIDGTVRSRSSTSTRCRPSRATGSRGAPVSTRVDRPRPTGGSASVRAASRPGARWRSWPGAI